MNLYAYLTSDRASKGQGGNEYIEIELTVQNGARKNYPIGELVLLYKDDVNDPQIEGVNQNEWVLQWRPYYENEWEIVAQGNVEPKGKKQKGKCKECRETKGHYTIGVMCPRHSRCTFGACKNIACKESGYDLCKKHHKRGINN